MSAPSLLLLTDLCFSAAAKEVHQAGRLCIHIWLGALDHVWIAVVGLVIKGLST